MQPIEAIQNTIRSHPRILLRGGGSKPALSSQTEGATILDLRDLSGILEYEPGEYTFTALAGTPLAEIEAALSANGQYLPFDPPLVAEGATLGGTVAAGFSGSGRYRYGGVRDFLIGIRFIDGLGRVVRGGGKVVKNAAGFDLPKLMVGSLGRLGALVEVSFKVFPRPQTYRSLRVSYPDLSSALAGMDKVAAAHFDLEALDMVVEQSPPEPVEGGGTSYTLWLRLGGWEAILQPRVDQLRALLGAGEPVVGEVEIAHWQEQRALAWAAPTNALVKIATNIAQIPALEAQLATTAAQRRYTVGGNLTWIAWPGAVRELHGLLTRLHLAGLVIRGATPQPCLGVQTGQAFAQRIKQALDPHGKFPEL